MRPGHVSAEASEAWRPCAEPPAEPALPVCYHVGVSPLPGLVRPSWLCALPLLGGLALAGCHGGRATVHWPKSAGAITPDDPAEDGGESLDPRRVSAPAAAVEHGGGDDITAILDQPSPTAPATSTPTPAGSSANPAPADLAPDGIPVFEDTIIVQ